MPAKQRRQTPSLKVKRNRGEMELRRQRGLSMLAEGKSQSEIAREIGVTPQAVSKWSAAYRSGGKKALMSKGKPGRKTGLTSAEIKRVEVALLKGPVKNGYRNDLWTLRRIAAVIAKVTDRPAPSTTRTWGLLREMGWSCQRPAKRARQQNTESVTEFREKTWTCVKKTPKNLEP
jgi:transposase